MSKNIIKIENNYSHLITSDKKLLLFLWEKLRFRDRNYYFHPLFKAKKWDGYVSFFSDKTGRFLTGLLPEVCYVLKMKEVEYEIDDRREKFEFIFNKIDENFFRYGNEPVSLYDYQVEIINKILHLKRGIIRVPTAGGKSMMAIGVCRCLPPATPTLILVNRKSLAEQIYNELVKWKVPNVGRVYAQYKDQNDITCCTIQSAKKLNNPEKIKCLIVDEIHELSGGLALNLYKQLKSAVVKIGMSATPFRFDSTDLVQKYRAKGWIGSPILIDELPEKNLTTKFLQERGTLSKSLCIFYPIDQPYLPHSIYQDAVTYGIAENEYLHDIVVRLVSQLKGRTLILVERIAHGDALKERMPNAYWLKGEDTLEDRLPIIEKLIHEKEDVVVIATAGIFNTGLNCKIHNLCSVTSGKAFHAHAQRIGRGLRISSDKEILNYYDFYFKNNVYLKKHSEQRIKIFKKLGHEVIVKDEIDF